jgi:hypothetical protein
MSDQSQWDVVSVAATLELSHLVLDAASRLGPLRTKQVGQRLNIFRMVGQQLHGDF